MTCPDVPWYVSHRELVTEQRVDCSLKVFLEMASPVGEVKNHAQCYFIQNDVSMSKWVNLVSDQTYVIATLDRRSPTQLCHVNLLKPYYTCVHQSADLDDRLTDAPCLFVSVCAPSCCGRARQGGCIVVWQSCTLWQA